MFSWESVFAMVLEKIKKGSNGADREDISMFKDILLLGHNLKEYYSLLSNKCCVLIWFNLAKWPNLIYTDLHEALISLFHNAKSFSS